MGQTGFYIHTLFISYYGLQIVLGMFFACLLAYVQIRRWHLSWNDFVLMISVIGLFAIVGAKLLYILVSVRQIDWSRITDLTYLQSVMSGGFVFYGGMIGGLLGLLIDQKLLKLNIAPYVQSCIGCIPVGHAFGRIGCHLVGCCHGIPYDGPFAITYTQSLFAPNNIPLFPVQLIEAILDMILAAVLLLCCKRWRGYTALGVYLLSYSVVRFVLEFFRADEARGSVFLFSTSQFISVVLFALGLLILYHCTRFRRATVKL